MRAMKVLFCLSLLLGVSHAQVPAVAGVAQAAPAGATGVAGLLNAQLTGAVANTGAPEVQAPPALAPELTTLGSLAIAQALSSSSPAEEAADAEVMCQTAKEALLALKTVTPSQLLMQADYAPQTGRKLLAGRALQQKEASACPGELSELQYGNCLNYFFTPDCHQAHEGVVNNLFGRGSPITTKTLKDVRDVVLHIFKDTEVCQIGGAVATLDPTATTADGSGNTCASGMEALKPVNYAQFMANAIAKIQQQPSPTQVGVNKQVSELAKAFTHLSSDADTVEVGESPSPPPPEPPAVVATGSLPIFIGLVFLALGGIGAALFFLRHKELMQHLKGMESATAAYTAMMSKVTEASQAAFGASGGDGMSKRASKKPREQLTEAGVTTTVPSNKPRAPTLQEKLNMLREANSAAGIKKNQK